MNDTFTREQTCGAILTFLRWGEQSYCGRENCDRSCGKQHGVLSGEGWDARVLRAHLHNLRYFWRPLSELPLVENPLGSKSKLIRAMVSDGTNIWIAEGCGFWRGEAIGTIPGHHGPMTAWGVTMWTPLPELPCK